MEPENEIKMVGLCHLDQQGCKMGLVPFMKQPTGVWRVPVGCGTEGHDKYIRAVMGRQTTIIIRHSTITMQLKTFLVVLVVAFHAAASVNKVDILPTITEEEEEGVEKYTNLAA
ncbi:uncharacterized protein CANTADRAFT_5597 [Suhomyces tanzawaensis NRRL Y-17324]|uniref:Uncharacterized protein n=1 Tax=Suhomyces tanzawaensis NRRL Y-17324 TaxID=984487 RepID=A0A1E4SK75_9ASCO|nr:uncharacterized protein CANTADRAFT_5597 [Suhomyces tanzawaensis NRRL Y-17324]ODV79904.1 hypothetical protein CANTADRAFT_5597 [Suhomyces tanzawaensis NRRL Y-17324]